MKDQRVRATVGLGLFCLCITGSSAARRIQPEPAQSEAPTGEESGVPVRGIVIPIGFQDGEYSAMVQIAVDGSPLPGATWNLEASLVVQGDPRKGISGRIVAGEPGTPAVLESQMTFKPGPYELTLKARETTAGQTGSGQLQGSWPNPDTRLAIVSPVAVLQPVQAAFVRDGNSRGMGALGKSADDPIQTELPVALVSLVCRGRAQPGTLRVERRLMGQTTVDFDPIQVAYSDGRCAQVRDMIRPGTLKNGWMTYEVRVLHGVEELVTVARKFLAVEPGQKHSRLGTPRELHDVVVWRRK